MSKDRARPRIFYGTLALAGAVVAYFVGATLNSGRRADACAEALADAAERHDAAYLDRAVRNPSVKAELLGAAHVEVGFVRPLSSEWTRIGLFVRRTATSTAMSALVLQLSADPAVGCVFLRDYDDGPFEGSGGPRPASLTSTSATTARAR